MLADCFFSRLQLFKTAWSQKNKRVLLASGALVATSRFDYLTPFWEMTNNDLNNKKDD